MDSVLPLISFSIIFLVFTFVNDHGRLPCMFLNSSVSFFFVDYFRVSVTVTFVVVWFLLAARVNL